MALNSYRIGLKDSEIKAIIDKHLPELNRNVEEYEELWEELSDASRCNSISQAFAHIFDRGPDMVLEIHSVLPWKPTPDEAVLLRAFVPNYVNAILETSAAKGLKVFTDGRASQEVLDYSEELCLQIQQRSKAALDAERRGA